MSTTKQRPTKSRNIYLKTVTGLMPTYQADTFFLKQHSKSKGKFVTLTNVETRKGYAYPVPDLKKKSILEIFNQWINDIQAFDPTQYPSVISTDLGSEFNSKDFYSWLEEKNIRLF